MNAEGHNHRLTVVKKLFQQPAKKAKLVLRGCVPMRRRREQEPVPIVTVCDGETQTTPTIEKSFRFEVEVTESKALHIPAESCVADSSRDSLNSDSNADSCEDSFKDYGKINSDAMKTSMKSSTFLCLDHADGHCSYCKCSLAGNALMEKLDDLQEELSSIHHTLCSLKSDEKVTSNKTVEYEFSAKPPSLPPMPPPLPRTPNICRSASQSVSLQLLPQKLPVSKICDELMMHDKGKPIVTVEDLQKVKLRQVSVAANKGGQPYL